MKRLNRRGKLSLLGLAVMIGGLYTVADMNDTKHTQAQAIEEERKKEVVVTYSIDSATLDSENAVNLYYAFSQDGRMYFTYIKTENPNQWETGYWELKGEFLESVGYNPNYFMHNDIIKVKYHYQNDIFKIVKGD